MERGEIVQAVRQVLDSNKSKRSVVLADLVVRRLEKIGVIPVADRKQLTPEQLKRAAYGAAHAIIQQVLDNGELSSVEITEFLPDGWEMQELDYEDLQSTLEGVVMSDLWEEQAKRDG